MKKIFKKIGLTIASVMMALSLVNVTPINAAGNTLASATNTAYDGEKIVNFARQWIGKIPYVWGGRNMNNPTSGLDCSGFVDFVFISLGYTDLQANLWGNTYKITDVGMTGTDWWENLMNQKNVTYSEGSVQTVSTGNAMPGDIVMYYDENGSSYHMGIYSGNGKLVHECEHLTTGDVNNVTESDLATCVSKHNVSMKSIRIYRVANSDPEYDTLKSTRTSTGKIDVNLTVNKTDSESNKALSNVEFEFHRVVDGQDIVLGTKKTNDKGVATIKSSMSKDFSAESSTYKFVSDWKGVSDSVKKVWLDKGYLDGTTENLKAAIQEQADKEADDQINNQIKAYESQSITYYAVEKNTKTKYWLNPETVKVSKTQTDSKDINWNMQNTRTKVTLELIKVDKDTNRAQGEATLEGAKYALYAASPILDPADDSVLYTTDTKVLEVTTDAEGKANAQNLYLGKYYWKEISAPKGYELDESKHEFEVKYSSQNIQVEKHAETIKENVITGKFEITKVITDGKNSSITQPESNAKFGVVLKKYVEQYGSVKDALDHKDEMSEKEYEIMTTDKNGHASSNELAYGRYVVAQLENGAEEVEILNEDFDFEVSESNQPTAYYVINNKPTEYQLLIEKVDFDTNQPVTLSSAKFKIKDSDGNYVSQSVGGKKYNTFVTNSDGKVGIISAIKNEYLSKEWTSSDDTKGTVITPATLKAGTYTIDEIETPKGFLALEKPVEFTINKSYVSEATEDGTPVIKVVVKNKQPLGKLIVNKSIESSKADKSFVDHKDLSGFEFTLFAKEDIVSPIDGEILIQANDKFGTFTTNEKGTISVENIPMGSYYLKETGTKPGFVLNEEVTDIIFTQKDQTTKEYTLNSEIENTTTKVEFSKKTITGDDELEGAHLVVTNDKGETIDEWDSGKNTHIIEGLEINQSYTLTETICPDGYVKATSISFKVENTGDIQKVTMIDKVVTITKEDVGGKELPGAKIQVLDEEQKVVDEWTSTNEAHKIKGLEEGKKYILHEDASPAGYALATDIEFTVSRDKEDQHLKMINKQVIINKLDQLNQNVDGAKLQVLDTNGTVIEEWTSGEEHKANNLKVGETYILHEVSAPSNYKKSDNIEFTVSDDAKNQFVNMIDIKMDDVSITKLDATNKKELSGAKLKLTDAKGNVIEEWTSTNEAHIVKGLTVGDSYTLTEITAPDGYQVAEKITFVVADNGKVVQQITMLDKPTRRPPNTGVYNNPMYAVLFAASGLALVVLLKKKKETK